MDMEQPEKPSSPQTHDPLDEVQEHMRSQGSKEDLERKARIEYLRSIAGPRKKAKRGWWKWVLGVIVLAAVLTGGGYWFLTRSNDSKDAKKSTAADNKLATPAANENKTITTKHHQSPTFNLEFDYPDDWTIADNGDGILTAKSPNMQLKGVSGKTVDGQIVITIQGKQGELKDFKAGNGLAVRESEKLSYAKPTASQRAQTYLSFVSYAGSTNPGIEGMYVTGDIGYQKDQAVPMVDIVRVDPLITVSFAGANASALSVSPSSWNDANLFTKSIKTVLTSLSIQ